MLFRFIIFVFLINTVLAAENLYSGQSSHYSANKSGNGVFVAKHVPSSGVTSFVQGLEAPVDIFGSDSSYSNNANAYKLSQNLFSGTSSSYDKSNGRIYEKNLPEILQLQNQSWNNINRNNLPAPIPIIEGAASFPGTAFPAMASMMHGSVENQQNFSEILASIDSPMKAAGIVLIQGAMITSLEKHAKGEKSGPNDTVQFQTNLPKDLAVLISGSQRMAATYLFAKSSFGYMFKELTLESFLNTTAPPVNDVSNPSEVLCSNSDQNKPIKNMFKNYLEFFNATKAVEILRNCGNKQKMLETADSSKDSEVKKFIPTISESTIKDFSFDKAVAEIDSPFKAMLISAVMEQMITNLERHAAGLPFDPTKFQTNMPKEAAALMAGIQRIAASQIYAKSQFGGIFKNSTMEAFMNVSPLPSMKFDGKNDATCEDFKAAKPMLDLLQQYLNKFNVKEQLKFQSIKNCYETAENIETTTTMMQHLPKQLLRNDAVFRKGDTPLVTASRLIWDKYPKDT